MLISSWENKALHLKLNLIFIKFVTERLWYKYYLYLRVKSLKNLFTVSYTINRKECVINELFGCVHHMSDAIR